MPQLPVKPNPTDFLVTPDLAKPEGWRYPIDHEAIAAMEARVGRNHDETTKRLTDVIAGRTVALCLNGASIKELEDRVEDFGYFDLCWMGMNKFRTIEHRILHAKLKRHMDIVFCMSEQEIPKRAWDIRDFLGRQEHNLFMTTLCALTWMDATERNWMLDNQADKLYLMPRLLCRPAYPISLEIIVDELIRAEVGGLILFGADGYWTPEMDGKTEEEIIRWNQKAMLDTYYDPGCFVQERRATGVGVGTMRFNANFRYQPDKIRIMNCSPGSHYKHIPVVSYDEALSALAVGGF